MTTYLFIHQNFPGQFPHVTRALAAQGDTVVALGESERIAARGLLHSQVRQLGYPQPKGAGGQTHHYLRGLEAHVRRGQLVFSVLSKLAREGFRPDVVVSHPGWGEAHCVMHNSPQPEVPCRT